METNATTETVKHIPFPSIDQYRNAIRRVKDSSQWEGKDENGDPVFDRLKPLPTLNYKGTVKLHGTNAAIVFRIGKTTEPGSSPESSRVSFTIKSITYQSRERVLSPNSDNAGFVAAMSALEDHMLDLVVPVLFAKVEVHEELTMAIFGEWCGGNIQAKVALNKLPKMFVVFAVKYGIEGGDMVWMNDMALSQVRCDGVHNILDFPTFDMAIDFARPELAQNELERITRDVEACCPVAKTLGSEGLGEGVVWRCVDEGWGSPDYWFKVKGEKHQSSKVKTLATVDVEKVNSVRELVEKVVTDSRCEQSLDKIREAGKPLDRSSLGDYIRWVYNDVLKEEGDTIAVSGLDPKELGGPVANKAKEWFFRWESAQG